MANRYTQVITTLATTNATSVYTVPDNKTAIVKTLSAYNVDGSSAMTLTVQVTDTSESVTATWDIESIAATTRKGFLTNGEVLVLDELDIIKLTASTADKFHIVIGVLEIDQETTMSNFPLKNAADQLATQGRYGDTMMVHMNPIEVDALAKLSPTGQLTINPQTGQPEAFLPLLGSLLAPTLLGGTALGATLGTVGASALGTGLGTIAEGGSLKEGITAGIMGGLTGGLLKGFMPATGADLAAEAGQEAVTQAVPDVSTLSKLQAATSPSTQALQAGQLGMEGGAAAQGFFDRLGGNLGITQGASQDMLTGVDPTGLTQSQAFMNTALPAAASGLVGEMYVPMDMGGPAEEPDPFGDYEGPYTPTEQRTMIPGSGGDPFGSAFGGEQMLIGGNPFPSGPEFEDGGKVSSAFEGLPAMSGLALAGNMMQQGGMQGLLPLAMDMYKSQDDKPNTEEEMKRQMIGTVPADMVAGMDAMQVPTDMLAAGGMPLQNPSKADLDNDGTLSSYERTRGKAIEGNMKNMGGLIRMATGGMPAQEEIARSSETLERMKIDQAIQEQLARSMSEPMIDPRLGRMADPISTPTQRTLNDVMTPQPYQAPSLNDIRSMQSQALDARFDPQGFNRQYNPVVRGIEAAAPVLTKGALELYEAIDEYRKRDN